MAYLRPITEAKTLSDCERKKLASAEIARVVGCGLEHHDLHWRHVGLASPRKKTKSSVLEARFFDVASAAQHSDAAAVARLKTALGIEEGN